MILPLACWPEALRTTWRNVQARLETEPSQSSALQVACNAEKSPKDLTRRHWDIDEVPIFVTPAMAKLLQFHAKELCYQKIYMMIRLDDTGERFADILERHDPQTQVLFRSNGVNVVVLKPQLERLRGAIVDYQESSFETGVLIRLLGE